MHNYSNDFTCGLRQGVSTDEDESHQVLRCSRRLGTFKDLKTIVFKLLFRDILSGIINIMMLTQIFMQRLHGIHSLACSYPITDPCYLHNVN